MVALTLWRGLVIDSFDFHCGFLVCGAHGRGELAAADCLVCVQFLETFSAVLVRACRGPSAPLAVCIFLRSRAQRD